MGPLLTARAQCPSNGQKLFKFWCRPNFASKRCLNLFSKGFSCSELFLDFCENRKGARKVSSMQGCFENSNMQWKKSKKKSREVKWWKSKYEIRTDLPSARARRFESDEQDLSPALVTTVRLVLENWTRTNLRPYATPSWLSLWIVWS